MKKAKNTWYYYIRDKANRPVITICLLKIGKDISKGIAICSIKDNPCKKTGRVIAKGRAVQAMHNKKDCCFIGRIHCSSIQMALTRKEEGIDVYNKALFNPVLTKFESKLLARGNLQRTPPAIENLVDLISALLENEARPFLSIHNDKIRISIQ